MEKHSKIIMLYDLYGHILTPRQRDIMDLYYNYDLSLSEIAENYNISRQGVHDQVRRSENILLETDAKLGILDKVICLNKDLDSLDQEIQRMEGLFQKCDETDVSSIVEKLNILRKQIIAIKEIF